MEEYFLGEINLKIIAKNYDFTKVKGLSMKQLTQHYKLYEGYVSKTNEIYNIINNTPKFMEGNQTYSKLRALLKGQSFALDGVKLHQLYFQNICLNNSEYNVPSMPYEILERLEKDFQGCERFVDLFTKSALSVRGWVVVALEPIDNKLHIYGCDAHDEGGIWNSIPILVLDVYEHAYMIDFGIDRKAYIDTFLKTINWDVVKRRLLKAEQLLKIT